MFFIWSVDSKENLHICCHQMASFKPFFKRSPQQEKEEEAQQERKGGV